MIKNWIEAMRLRTLPVSIAGVILGWGYAWYFDAFSAVPATLCMLFAVLAQIASNFANEYYDFKSGLDKPGREGPRRGVTEGDITPHAMKLATFITLGAACLTGLGLLFYGGWWLLIVGAVIALGALAYSAGPYPLSHHGWGEVAVLLFFGVIPVNFTFYVQSLAWSNDVIFASIGLGLMGANVLIINNYRDIEDDRAVGKRTLAVKLGLNTMSNLYLFNGYIGVATMVPTWYMLPAITWLIPLCYLMLHTALWMRMLSRRGSQLNPMLGMTAILMLLYSVGATFALAW